MNPSRENDTRPPKETDQRTEGEEYIERSIGRYCKTAMVPLAQVTLELFQLANSRRGRLSGRLLD